jgi:hypothetical protein
VKWFPDRLPTDATLHLYSKDDSFSSLTIEVFRAHSLLLTSGDLTFLNSFFSESRYRAFRATQLNFMRKRLIPNALAEVQILNPLFSNSTSNRRSSITVCILLNNDLIH